MILLSTFFNFAAEQSSRASRVTARVRFLVLFLALAAVLMTSVVEAQRSRSSSDRLSPEVKHAARSITARECLEHVVWLADDLREGRLAGSRGCRDSAEYIKKAFELNGLLPGGTDGGWYQEFSIPGRRGARGPIEAGNRLRLLVSENALTAKALNYNVEFLPHPRSPDGELATGCAYFLEPMQTADQMERDPIKDKIAVLSVDELLSDEILDQACADIVERGGVGLILVGDAYQPPDDEDWTSSEVSNLLPIPVMRVYGKGGAKIWQISGRPERSWKHQSEIEGALWMGRPFVHLEVNREGRDLSLGRNVVGRLLGSDAGLREQYVIIGAHYDHVGRGEVAGSSREGKGEIHNGADDNASGVAAMLELAEAYALNRLRPKRTLIFVAFDAEELGLHGSTAFVADGGYSVDAMQGMVNLDMISRNDPKVIKVCRRASDKYLGSVIEEMARVLRLTIDESGMDAFLNRSDQAPFLRADVPAVFFFGGLHDDYHTADDDVSGLIPVKMENVGRLAFLTAWGLLQQVDEPDDSSAEDPN